MKQMKSHSSKDTDDQDDDDELFAELGGNCEKPIILTYSGSKSIQPP